MNQSSQYQQELSNRRKNAQRRDRLITIGVGLVLVLFFFFKASGGKSISSSSSQQTRINTTSQSISTSRPQKASPQKTNETPSPKKNVVTGYDDNHPYLNDNGLCEITIDNTKNDMPVYARIWDMNKHKPVCILH